MYTENEFNSCLAAAFAYKNKLPNLQRDDPCYYSYFVNLIKISNSKCIIVFPISLAHITELERLNRSGGNPIPFRINVFREDHMSNKVYLVRSSQFDDGKIINVLLIEIEKGENDYLYYILIDSTSFLKKHYINSENRKISYRNSAFCSRCFEQFRSKKLLEGHEEVCGKADHIKVFPKEDDTIEYINHEYNFKRIYTGYADFEIVLKDTVNKLECPECVSSITDCDGESGCMHSFTITTKKHYAIFVSFIIVDRYGSLAQEFAYTGDDVVVKFIRNVLHCEDVLVNTTKFNKYMIFNEENGQDFEMSTMCFICNNDRGRKGKRKTVY